MSVIRRRVVNSILNLFPVAFFQDEILSDRLQAPSNHRGFGHWAVKFDDPRCKSLWKDFQDKIRQECVVKASKTRLAWVNTDRYHWREMCSTTPADSDGHQFDQPDRCEYRGTFNGVWGVWFVKDESC
ncbi:hypothetical protein EDD18DRAFT_1115642 [Armillaria luteobubalina]|uniref:Uncharacterized protein n=1 Tax=Armillaria luteobubalina TaxID=153913 RepID=A0AA39P2A6_9AGAR|nr:hypothetical protein EDD18DRAFT_1115642 [Armillaria luteobubalina]